MNRPLAVLSLALAACATISPERGHDRVAAVVEERTGHRTRWNQGSPEDAQVAQWVADLLKSGLTRDRAVELALLNNHELQAAYEELGISQAEAVQAGLLKNPTLSGSFGVPLPGGGIAEFESALVQDVLDLIVLPSRSRIANAQFEADVLRVAHEALAVAAETEKAFVAYQARKAELAVRHSFVDAQAASAELAKRLFDAGNITTLARDAELVAFEQARLDLQADELALADARETLNRLLGLWGEETAWEIADALPPLPTDDPPLEHLEATAMKWRLDVDAARKRTELLGEAVELATTFRYVGSLELGVHAHRDADGPRLIGPTISLELPIFDQRQALIARLEAERRQGERRLQEASVRARSEVRQARLHLVAAREAARHWETVLVPLRQRMVDDTLLQYDAMQVGPADVLMAKQRELEASRGAIEALATYWTARAELERALGGKRTK